PRAVSFEDGAAKLGELGRGALDHGRAKGLDANPAAFLRCGKRARDGRRMLCIGSPRLSTARGHSARAGGAPRGRGGERSERTRERSRATANGAEAAATAPFAVAQNPISNSNTCSLSPSPLRSGKPKLSVSGTGNEMPNRTPVEARSSL